MSQSHRLTLVYGLRLIQEEIGTVEHAHVLTEGGQMHQVTMHLLEGTKEEIQNQLRASLDAFFDLHD